MDVRKKKDREKEKGKQTTKGADMQKTKGERQDNVMVREEVSKGRNMRNESMI